jgi:thiol-disulfide isomerase/thioredoxin
MGLPYPNVKKIIIALLVIMLVLDVHAQQLPATLITDVHSGKKVPFSETIEKGKVTLISFWATWCIPGKREVKTIVRNMAAWKKQADFNYIAIAVDQQQNEELARSYALAQHWSFPSYIDAQSDLKLPLNFHALPFIIIIDKQGKIVFTHTGHDDGTLILAKLKEVAGKRLK